MNFFMASEKISAEEAVKKAKEYFKNFTSIPESRLALEEIEFNKQSFEWKITLSIERGLGDILPGYSTKEFSAISIDAKTGEFLSIKRLSTI